ncbi:MAG: hypothetical protein N3A58_02105 [Spirochaetes bacterium]|nr:hypothetical protein [Spirochaetota bacterium]
MRGWRDVPISGDSNKIAITRKNEFESKELEKMCISSNGQKIIAFVENGGVYLSNDGGNNWEEKTNLGNNNWVSVSMSSDGSIIALLVYGEGLYYSKDGGNSWVIKNDNSFIRIWDFIFISSNGSYSILTGKMKNIIITP